MIAGREICAVLAFVLATGCSVEPEQRVRGTAAVEFRLVAAESAGFRDLEVGEKPARDGDQYRWVEVASNGQCDSNLVKEKGGVKYVPIQMVDEFNLSGTNIANVKPITDANGRIAIELEVDPQAQERFERLSTRHKRAGNGGMDPRELAIIVNGKVFRAYQIADTFSDTLQVSGGLTESERADFIATLTGTKTR